MDDVTYTPLEPGQLKSTPQNTPQNIPSMVVRIAREQGVDPDLALRIAHQESAFNPAAVSPQGARGVMQLMPGTARDMGVTDVHDPEQNITGGVKYLAYLGQKFGGDEDKVRAAYHSGPDFVEKNGLALGPAGMDYLEKTAPNRGSKIASEMKQDVSYTPMFPETPAAPVKAPEKGLVGNIMEAAKSGAAQSLKDLASAGDALLQSDPSFKEPTNKYSEALSWADLLHPTQALPKAVYQLSRGAPVLTAGAAGAVGAGVMFPEAPGAASVVGGSLGAAAMQVAQSIGPRYAAEIKASPNDPEGAFDRALKKAGTEGAFTAAGWAAFAFSPFEGAVKNLLFQAFAVQPGVSAVEQATSNAQEGKPLGEGVVEGYPATVVGTLLPAAGMGAAHALLKGKAAPAAEGAPAATPPTVGAEAPEAPVVRPTGPVEPEGLPIQYPGAPTYSKASEPLNPSSEPTPFSPKLAPLEQARADAEVLKRGGIPADADDTRLRNASLISLYGENAAVKHAIENPDLSAVGDAMLLIAPKVEQVRKTLQANQQNRDITTDVMTAIDELARIKADGKTVDEIMAHGLSHEVSFEAQELIRFLDQNANNPQNIAQFMERYLQIVQDMGGVPSDVRGKAFDIIAERNAAKREHEEAQARAQKEGAEAKQVKTQTQIATEQAQAENALTEIAKARASGSGINPEHQTAMEIAFQNARSLKEKKSEKSEPVRAAKTGPAEAVGGENPGPAKPREVSLPVSAEAGKPGDTRPVRQNGSAAGAGKNVALTQRDLRKINVTTNAIEVETGRRIEVTERADVALKKIDHQIKTMEGLLECLS